MSDPSACMEVCEPSITLTIEGTSLNGSAWNAVDLWELTEDPEFIQSTILIPHRDGRITLPSIPDQTDYEILLYIATGVDRDGTTYANGNVGVLANVRALQEAVFHPASNETGTKSATLATPLGNYTREVKVGPLKVGEGVVEAMMADGVTRFAAPASFTLTIPGSSFVTNAQAQAATV